MRREPLEERFRLVRPFTRTHLNVTHRAPIRVTRRSGVGGNDRRPPSREGRTRRHVRTRSGNSPYVRRSASNRSGSVARADTPICRRHANETIASGSCEHCRKPQRRPAERTISGVHVRHVRNRQMCMLIYGSVTSYQRCPSDPRSADRAGGRAELLIIMRGADLDTRRR